MVLLLDSLPLLHDACCWSSVFCILAYAIRRYDCEMVIISSFDRYIYIYDHLSNPWGTQPELVIPELNGGRVKIEVPPSLYISLHSISVSEVVV